MTDYATRLHAADATVTVVSSTRAVTTWSRRYFGPWWHAVELDEHTESGGRTVLAEVDPVRYASLAEHVAAATHDEIRYARVPTRVARDQAGVITAVSPDQHLAYRSEPDTGRLCIYGRDPQPVAVAAARLARESMRGVLLQRGWALLHASAVARGQRALLAFGGKGAGKTTAALALARWPGWELLANDRVFARADDAGHVRVLPCPAAAAIGLGLLTALGWRDTATRRLRGGGTLHPTQDPRVTEALLAGRSAPLFDGPRELKAQLWPDQFGHWFGLTLSTGAYAAGLLFPHVRSDATPAITDDDRVLTEQDFMTGATEDRYPDVFDLAPGVDSGGQPEARTHLAHHLAALPHHTVVLGHGIDANADFLTRLAAAM